MNTALYILSFLSVQNPNLPILEPQTSGTTHRLQAVSVVNDRVVWVSGTGGTWARTLDGGATWQTGVVPGADSLEFRDVHGFSERVAYLLAAGPGQKSRIYKTLDGGRRWLQQFQNPDSLKFYDCFSFWNANTGFAISDGVNGRLPVLRTTDGGGHWTMSAASPHAGKGEGAFAASGTCVATLGDSLGWFATGAGDTAHIFRTRNRGRSWLSATTPIAQGSATSGHSSVAFRTPLEGIAVGGDLADTLLARPDNVIISHDGGATWTNGGRLTFVGPAYGGAVVPGTPATVVAVGPRGASWSVDGGVNWLPLDTTSHWSVAFAGKAAGWMVGPQGRITKVRLP